jgi:hypothetical protein
MIVVSDTSLICYLLLINQIEILQVLYNVVTIPQTVADELSASESPPVVKNWIAQPPKWLQIQATETSQNIELEKLDPGEREAIGVTFIDWCVLITNVLTISDFRHFADLLTTLQFQYARPDQSIQSHNHHQAIATFVALRLKRASNEDTKPEER